MKKLISIRFCLIVTLLLGLTACDYPQKKPQTIKFLDESFSVLKPSSWSEKSDLNDQADLQMADYYKEAYVVILSENKHDFDDITLEGHSDLTRSSIRDGVKNLRESEPETFRIGKIPALRYRLSGSVEGIKIVYWHVTLETKNHFHQILLWSLPSKFSSNENDFNAVIQSFKVLK